MSALHRFARFAWLLSALLMATSLHPPEARATTVSASAQAQIKPGMTQAEVQGVLGLPPRKRHIGRTGEDVWRYETAKFETWFEIAFDKEGRVTSTQLVWVPPF